MCIKSDFEAIILKLATYGQREKAFLLSSKFCSQWIVSAKLATNGQSHKGFLLTSTFVPKGLFAPALGLYTCTKALKYIPGPGVRGAFTGLLINSDIYLFCENGSIDY